MSSILSCRDARFDCAYSASTSRATVDVSTATLVSLWDAGLPRELPRPVPAHDTLQDSVWSDQLSPQLQRNKQLQDTLLQKEEELARLQDENNKLKQFLNSSYVKSLGDRWTRSADRKRALQDDRDFLTVSRLLQGGEGKRTCRNLSLEFCSADEVAATPALDSWVLETLGLQDEDTINTDSSFSSSTTERTASFSSPSSCALQDGAVYSPYSDSQREYGGAVGPSGGFGHRMDRGVDYITSKMYTVTSTGSLQDIHVSCGHFTPPTAASTPQRSHVPSSETSRHGRRTELAFSMSLSPQNSVKTHTFTQGQAFTRRDSQGGWNFTWVPRECSNY